MSDQITAPPGASTSWQVRRIRSPARKSEPVRIASTSASTATRFGSAIPSNIEPIWLERTMRLSMHDNELLIASGKL